MKKLIGMLFIVAVLLITFSSSDYVDASYDTKASITFIEPEDEESNGGDESEAGDIPGGIIVVDEGESPQGQSEDSLMEDSSKSKAEGTLPKTATNIYLLLLLGFVILLAGVSFLIYYNRKKEKLNQK